MLGTPCGDPQLGVLRKHDSSNPRAAFAPCHGPLGGWIDTGCRAKGRSWGGEWIDTLWPFFLLLEMSERPPPCPATLRFKIRTFQIGVTQLMERVRGEKEKEKGNIKLYTYVDLTKTTHRFLSLSVLDWIQFIVIAQSTGTEATKCKLLFSV